MAMSLLRTRGVLKVLLRPIFCENREIVERRQTRVLNISAQVKVVSCKSYQYYPELIALASVRPYYPPFLELFHVQEAFTDAAELRYSIRRRANSVSCVGPTVLAVRTRARGGG